MGKIVFLFLFLPYFANALDCDLKTICKSVKSNPTLPDRKTKSGRVIQGGSLELKISECPNNNCLWKDEKKKKSLFDDAQIRIQKIILKGRKFDQLSAGEKAVVNTFKNVKLLDANTNSACKEDCSSGAGNGSYSRDGVCICSNMEVFPEETLISLMGHEICHSAEPCSHRFKGMPGESPFTINNPNGSIMECLKANGINPNFKKVFSCEIESRQMNEGICDVLGIEVLADFLTDHPFEQESPENMLRSLSYFANFACELDIPMLSHPMNHKRINDIALTIPAFRKALNCRGHVPNFSCDYRPATK